MENLRGLTKEEVNKRLLLGQNNVNVENPSKSIKEIIKDNVCTYFNLVFLIIAIILILVDSLRDLTFLPIIIANTMIGIVQEIRSKKVIDELTMLNSRTSLVLRDNELQEIEIENLVIDDIVKFSSGNQIVADAVVVDGKVNVNESLLTGEEDEIEKKVNDNLLSGSFITSGTCYAKLTKVGLNSYISKLTLEAKSTQQEEQSEIIKSLNKIVKLAGIVIIPIGLTLFCQQYVFGSESLKSSVQAAVASVIGMIPEGLFLLSSVTLAISSMKLALKKVLLHNMKSIETLARVNCLCVDKTGTITDGTMKLEKLEILEFKENENSLKKLIGDFVGAQENDNATINALKNYFKSNNNKKALEVYGFSSVFKYSAINFDNEFLVLGAPEFVLGNDFKKYEKTIENYANEGFRVLVFGKSNELLNGKKITSKITPYAFIVLSNPIRENAKETFEYFKNQGVEIKVISGDNPLTVSKIALKAGIENANSYIDATNLKTEKEMENAILNYTVFGRVSPEQKRTFVKLLQKNGKTVAMTGDGVNDCLALKVADCSVAMASGSDAAMQISQVVLLESDFSKMPEVVLQGRQVVNNLERSGSLFLVKNIFSFLISVLAIFFNVKYPLEPSQVSLISMFTIGIPAFFLSQIPNKDIIKGNFLKNILFKAIPGGIVGTIIVAATVVFGNIFKTSPSDISSSSTILLAIIGLLVLLNISKPMDKYKWYIWGFCAFGLTISIIFLKDLFSITDDMSVQGILLCINFALIAEVVLRYLTGVFELVRNLIEKLKIRLKKS